MVYTNTQGVILKDKNKLAMFLVAIGFAIFATLSFKLPASAAHNGAVVTYDSVECGTTTISAEIADPSGTHKVSNMFLVVDTEDGDPQSSVIPTNGSSAEIEVGPFESASTTISWNVFGGGERAYDQPLWDGYGDPGFGAGIVAYAADQGGYSWVLDGTDEPNPFVNWNEIEATCVSGEITSPTEGSLVAGTLNLAATYDDGDTEDNDSVFWAVRDGTCAANTGTVAGNVDGYDDDYNWDTVNFSATLDVSEYTPGEYCFVFNPNGNNDNVRETSEFTIVEVLGENKELCKKGGWEDFSSPEFRNQGDCVSFFASENQQQNNPDANRGRR